MFNLTIRTVTRTDLPALEWGGEYTHFRRVYASAYREQEQGRAVLWIAELPKAGIIGQTFVQLISARPELADGGTRGYLYSVRVRAPYQRQGIGTRLLQWAEADLERRGFYIAVLNVNKEKQEPRRWYERLGYRITADEPGDWSYIDHHGQRRYVHEPSWRMEKQL